MGADIVNGYCTLDDLKDHLHHLKDHTDDGLMVAQITAASRAVDSVCGRRFYMDTAETGRVFATDVAGRVRISDCFSVTTVATDGTGDGVFETVWASTDWQPEPLNGAKDGIEGWPVEWIRAIESRCFPTGRRARVQVTGVWGWAAVPEPVRLACLLTSAKLYKRRDTPEGIVGFEGAGVRALMSTDRDAMSLLAPYERTVA